MAFSGGATAYGAQSVDARSVNINFMRGRAS